MEIFMVNSKVQVCPFQMCHNKVVRLELLIPFPPIKLSY